VGYGHGGSPMPSRHILSVPWKGFEPLISTLRAWRPLRWSARVSFRVPRRSRTCLCCFAGSRLGRSATGTVKERCIRVSIPYFCFDRAVCSAATPMHRIDPANKKGQESCDTWPARASPWKSRVSQALRLRQATGLLRGERPALQKIQVSSHPVAFVFVFHNHVSVACFVVHKKDARRGTRFRDFAGICGGDSLNAGSFRERKDCGAPLVPWHGSAARRRRPSGPAP
jgi:hypothetical protein